MEYISREQWGARPPTWNPGPVTSSAGVFIHYNGGNPLAGDVAGGVYDAVCAHLRSTQQFHMGPSRGWPDIAYSWCVDGSGRVYELRGWGVAGAHTMGWNERSHAIYLPLGGLQAPTDAQVAGCRMVIAEHDRRYGKGFIRGHRQAPNSTSCPGEPTMAVLNAGKFSPYTNPTPQPPRPPGVDPNVKPTIMRRSTDGTISVFYPDSPFRIDLKKMEDVQKFKFFGAVDKGNADPWFWTVTSAVKCG
jgi:hypothetical protein